MGKKFFRILLAALAVYVFMTIFSSITNGWLFTHLYRVEPTNIFKPMEDAPPLVFWIGSFVMYIIFVLVYVILSKGIPAKSIIGKGIIYGLCIWATGDLCGMFYMYVFMTVAPQVLLYWTISGLVTAPVCGIITAKITDRI